MSCSCYLVTATLQLVLYSISGGSTDVPECVNCLGYVLCLICRGECETELWNSVYCL